MHNILIRCYYFEFSIGSYTSVQPPPSCVSFICFINPSLTRLVLRVCSCNFPTKHSTLPALNAHLLPLQKVEPLAQWYPYRAGPPDVKLIDFLASFIASGNVEQITTCRIKLHHKRLTVQNVRHSRSITYG